MNIASAKGITATDAVSSAHQYFAQFYAGINVQNVLLEEIDFDEANGTWRVVIGFDLGRKKFRQPGLNALAGFLDTEEVPIREARAFVISDANRQLISMKAA